jgi:ribonuclease P protein component
MVFGPGCDPRAVVRSFVRDDARVVSGLPSEGRRGYPAYLRLKQRADFQRVYRRGVRVTGRYLVLFLMPTDGHTGRFGVTASRRVGGAVVRSRCKRRLRELYRLHREVLGGREFDMVANARNGCATAPWDGLERDFLHCLRRGLDSAATARLGGNKPGRGRS